jgi:hypothetical protein
MSGDAHALKGDSSVKLKHLPFSIDAGECVEHQMHSLSPSIEELEEAAQSKQEARSEQRAKEETGRRAEKNRASARGANETHCHSLSAVKCNLRTCLSEY